MLWINEDFVLDDAGNMLTTSHIDLRDKDERTVIRSLVKGCKREHALEDYARLGDIVDSVWLERDCFVVIHIRKSEELKATGRIVVGPSGGYAYCFKRAKSENMGYSEGHLGKLLFPLGHDVESSSPSAGRGNRRSRRPKKILRSMCEQASASGLSVVARMDRGKRGRVVAISLSMPGLSLPARPMKHSRG